MSSKAKKIIVFLLVLAIGAASAGYLLWNKPHQDVADARAIPVTSEALYSSFLRDSAAAKAKYLQQVLEVTGKVTNVSVNQQQQKLVLLQTATEGASVNCTFEDKSAEEVAIGKTITVKGICSGIGEGDADMGIVADVYLVRCYFTKE